MTQRWSRVPRDEPSKAARIVGQALAGVLVAAVSCALVIVLVALLLALVRWSWQL